MLGAAPSAGAAPPNPGIAVEDGATHRCSATPTPSASGLGRVRLRHRRDGVADRIALDIVRPAASAAGLKVPVIMDASPYYSSLGRGNESENKSDVDGDG